MSADSERLDRLEAIVAKALNIDFSEFDTPSQAKDRAEELKKAEEIQAKQLVVEQKESGVTAAEDRIAAEEAAGSKKAPTKVSVQQLTAGPRHLVTDGTTGGPQPSDTGTPKTPSTSGKPKTTSSSSTSSKKPEASASSSSSSKAKG